MLSTAKSRKSCLLVIPALVILMTLGLFPMPGFASTYNIDPTADAAVYSSNPTSNYGTDTVWWVGRYGAYTLYYTYAYLKFDLSSIPPSEQITGAALYAYCLVRSPSTATPSIQLLPVPDTSWIESGTGGITWNNKKAYGSLITTVGGIVGWNHWTIPAANLPASGLVSFVLIAVTSGQCEFYSRENGSNKPYLQVTTKKKPMSPAANTLLLLDE